MKKQKIDIFDYIYSFFMLLFGIVMIFFFLMAVVFMFEMFSFFFLIFCWPILIGIWTGIFRKSDKGYEMELKPKDAKKLDGIFDKIIKLTGQKKPHKIILSEGSEIGVSGLFNKKLVIGLATLQLMEEKDLLAIIAHEYGHFANKDTILGYLIYRIRNFIDLQRDISRANIDSDFLIIFYLPTYLFFYLFSRYYSLITLWHNRKREYRADRLAADLVGEQEFADAVVKYSIVSNIFEEVAPAHVLHFLEQEKQLINIYDYINPIYTTNNVKAFFKAVLTEKSSFWSTHPSISERLEALNIKTINVDIKTNLKDFFLNQKKYEEEASNVMSQKLNYWRQMEKDLETWALIQDFVQSEEEGEEED